MKTKIWMGIFWMSLMLIMGGCEKPDEVPPRALGQRGDYVLPKARPLSLEEREYYRQLKEEYENAIKD